MDKLVFLSVRIHTLLHTHENTHTNTREHTHTHTYEGFVWWRTRESTAAYTVAEERERE